MLVIVAAVVVATAAVAAVVDAVVDAVVAEDGIKIAFSSKRERKKNRLICVEGELESSMQALHQIYKFHSYAFLCPFREYICFGLDKNLQHNEVNFSETKKYMYLGINNRADELAKYVPLSLGFTSYLIKLSIDLRSYMHYSKLSGHMYFLVHYSNYTVTFVWFFPFH